MSLTNDGVFVSVFQLGNGHKVTLHCGDFLTVVTRHNGCISVQRHLIVVLQRIVLFVGHLQRCLGDVVHLQGTDERGALASFNQTWSFYCDFEATVADRIERPLY